MFTSILFCLYFFILLMFSLVRHCIYYCLLLMVRSLVGGLICYSVYGFSWYSVLLCLVYIGGVYILFIFVSVFNPKNSLITYVKLNYFILFCIAILALACSYFIFYEVLNIEFREHVCTSVEGRFYVCMCFALIFGFIMLRMVIKIKASRYR